MKIDSFKDLLESRCISVIPAIDHSDMGRWRLNDLKALKRMSRYIPFPCKFDEKGKCNCPTSANKTQMCCCANCQDNVGFLTIMPEQDIPKYVKVFSVKTGFWRKGRGCLLSRELRSNTCLSYYCADGWPHSTQFGVELNAYLKALRALEKEYLEEVNNG